MRDSSEAIVSESLITAHELCATLRFPLTYILVGRGRCSRPTAVVEYGPGWFCASRSSGWYCVEKMYGVQFIQRDGPSFFFCVHLSCSNGPDASSFEFQPLTHLGKSGS